MVTLNLENEARIWQEFSAVVKTRLKTGEIVSDRLASCINVS